MTMIKEILYLHAMVETIVASVHFDKEMKLT